jgi:hypothetical protein
MLVKADHFDSKVGPPLYQLIDNLVTAHVKNYYDGKPQLNPDGVQVMEWSPLLKFVSRLRPDLWPPEPAPEIQKQNTLVRKPKVRQAVELERVKAAMRVDIKSGKLTSDRLVANDEALAADYDTSRSTARRAREDILPELIEDPRYKLLKMR